jgi:RNA polymerase sigma factor (sigma-70 family)
VEKDTHLKFSSSVTSQKFVPLRDASPASEKMPKTSFQQTFQKAFIHLTKFEGKSSFSTWLTRIAVNEALMLLRKGRRLREISIDDSTGNEDIAVVLEIPDSRAGPEGVFLQDEQNRTLFAAMSQLTPGTRKAIELRDLSELSAEEAALVMGISVIAVKGHLFHGRRKLHQILVGELGGKLVGSRQFNCERKRRSYGMGRREK